MKRKPNPERVDRDNPEWTDADFKRAPCRRSVAEIGGQEGRRTAVEISREAGQ